VKLRLRNGTRLDLIVPPKLSECINSFSVSLSSQGDHRLAKDKFGGVADEFMTYVHRQMGVKVFMLVAFKNEQGQDIISKSVFLSLRTVQLLKMFAELRLVFRQEDHQHSCQSSISMVVRCGTAGGHMHLKVIFFKNQIGQHLMQLAAVPEVALPSKKHSSDRSSMWPLDLDEDGMPILPSGVGRNLPDIKNIIRSFLTIIYSM